MIFLQGYVRRLFVLFISTLENKKNCCAAWIKNVIATAFEIPLFIGLVNMQISVPIYGVVNIRKKEI